MNLKLLITSIIILLGIAYGVWDQMRPPTQQVSSGKANIATAPDSKLSLLHGNQKNIHDYRGKVIFVNFWATWCPPCIKEFPDLLSMAASHQDEMVLITISVDEDKAVIERFFKRLDDESKAVLNSENVVLAFDPEQSLSNNDFQTFRYPETYIINPRLEIVDKISGIAQWNSEDMSERIKTLYSDQ